MLPPIVRARGRVFAGAAGAELHTPEARLVPDLRDANLFEHRRRAQLESSLAEGTPALPTAALWSDSPRQLELDGALKKSTGFTALTADEQATIVNAVQGSDPFTDRAQLLLGRIVDASEFKSASAADQSTALRGYLTTVQKLNDLWTNPRTSLEASPGWDKAKAETRMVLSTWLRAEEAPGATQTPTQLQMFLELSDPRWDARSPQQQGRALDSLVPGLTWTNQVYESPAEALANASGWATLTPDEQAAFKAILDVKSNPDVEMALSNVRAVAGNPSFAKRHTSTQADQLRTLLGQLTLARQGWQDWEGAMQASPGWAKLEPREQSELLRMLGTNVRDPQASLARVVRDAAWPFASEGSQKLGLRALLADLRGKEISDNPELTLQATPGYAALPADTQTQINLALRAPAYGLPVRKALRALLNEPTWESEPVAAQVAALEKLATRATSMAAVAADPAAAVQATPGFARLSAAQKADLLALVGTGATATVADGLTAEVFTHATATKQSGALELLRSGLRQTALATDLGATVKASPGFGSLSTDEQAKMAALWTVNDTLTAEAAADFAERLDAQGPWTSLDANQQAGVLRAALAAWQPKIDVWKDPVAALRARPALSAMSPAAAERLQAVASQTSNPISLAVRTALADALTSDEVRGLPVAEQAAKLAGFLTDRSLLPGEVGVYVDPRPQRPYTLSGPTLVPGHAFQGQTKDADSYQLTIGGHTLTVYVPHQALPSTTVNGEEYAPLINHTVGQVAGAFARLGDANLKALRSVTLNSGPNPDDSYWTRVYNIPDFTSYMTSGIDGDVSIYPIDEAEDEQYMAASALHESGHSISQQHWGDADSSTDPRWQPFRDAAAQDMVRPSDYAYSSYDELVAEMTALYQSVRVNPELFEEYRKVFPSLFAIMDPLLAEAGGTPAPVPAPAPVVA